MKIYVGKRGFYIQNNELSRIGQEYMFFIIVFPIYLYLYCTYTLHCKLSIL